MSFPKVSRWLGLLACTGVLLACRAPERAPQRLLLITLDTLRADRLGIYGSQTGASPSLDAFAAESTVFRDVTCSMPTTLPSHLTIFTGLAPDQHRVMQNGVIPDAELISVFELLQDSGLETAAIVSSGVLAARFLQGLGLGEILDGGLEKNFHQLPAPTITDRALEWLAGRGDQPYALWLHYFDTHEPYTPPADLAARFAGDYDGELPDAIEGPLLRSLNEREEPLSDIDRIHVSNLYDAEVAYLDRELGRLFTTLEQMGALDGTLVVIVGDHGQALGEQSRWGHGEWLLEPIIRVPLIIRQPGQSSGRTILAPVETLDVAPTIAELFDLRLPEGLRGRSLVPALEGEELGAGAGRVVVRRLYADAPERRGVALLRGNQKWLYYRDLDQERFHLGLESGAGGLDGESFFDPDSAGARSFAQLARGIDDLKALPIDTSEETRDMLRSLGYLP